MSRRTWRWFEVRLAGLSPRSLWALMEAESAPEPGVQVFAPGQSEQAFELFDRWMEMN